jgi:hypothetical protein
VDSRASDHGCYLGSTQHGILDGHRLPNLGASHTHSVGLWSPSRWSIRLSWSTVDICTTCQNHLTL